MERLGSSLWFVGWLGALAVVFGLGLRLPLQTRLSRLLGLAYTWAVVAVACGVAVLANVGLVRHDAHFDLTKERTFTPAGQAEAVVASLTRDVTLTYFYHAADQNGRRAKTIVEVLGRQSPHLHVRTVDPDKQPRLAELYGIRLYNAAVLEADGRRVEVMGTDEIDIALGMLRLLRRSVVTVCFLEGHGEYPFDNFEFHTHVETLQAHTHGDKSSALVQMEGHGAGRLRRALEALGYEARKVITATASSIPTDCAAVVAVGPRATYLPTEGDLLADYLAHGGAALLLYDLGFVVEPRLEHLLARLGVRMEQGVVIDPLDHYATDLESVAVPVHEPHPITSRVALTFYPGVRPLTLLPPAPGISVTPLFYSSKDSYVRSVKPVEERHPRAIGPAAPPSASPGSDQPGRRLLAAAVEGRGPDAVTGSRPFRVVVVGDADFASNSFFPYMSNSDMVLSMVRWLSREERAPKIRPSVPVPRLLFLTKQQMKQVFLVIEGLLPLSVVLCGAVVWWRRR
jgi:gliding motility-associatede transport system auxiliary component